MDVYNEKLCVLQIANNSEKFYCSSKEWDKLWVECMVSQTFYKFNILKCGKWKCGYMYEMSVQLERAPFIIQKEKSIEEANNEKNLGLLL